MSKRHQHSKYIICIKGHLSRKWLSKFDDIDMTINLTDAGVTELNVSLADQAALHGLLRKIRDTGADLISVNLINSDSDH